MYCVSSINLCADGGAKSQKGKVEWSHFCVEWSHLFNQVEVTCGGHASIEGPSWVPMHEDLVGQQNPTKISRSGVHHSCVSLFIGLFIVLLDHIRTLELV
ncbi:hypothetical protein TorRG33x02_029270 [Trema orientale]|uniref:Uncharacterized protein n=1 Tax=Trema orientale TaxID=63057 RepID=A0A2P5FTQ0_TREOI|nr:hypothetical protein TorRG33x02_029270 [Trema orientale]